MSIFLTTPDEIKLSIFSYCSYDEMSRIRVVCKDFNRIAMDALNQGFALVEKFHCTVQKDIKKKLPRRESERRDHKFSRHADILSAIETRMSLLQITYAKYIEAGYTCFIPGKVLDELFRVLRYVQNAIDPPRSHEVLMELRDISSMAMEHFEDKILPSLRKLLEEEGVTILPGGLTVGLDHLETKSIRNGSSLKRTSGLASPSCSPLAKKRRFNPIDLDLRTNVGTVHTGDDGLVERLAECEKVIVQQDAKIEEQGRMLSELNRKLIDYNVRFNKLAGALINPNEQSTVQDRISALIQPIQSADSSTCTSGVASHLPPTFTSIVTRTRKADDVTLKHDSSLLSCRLSPVSSKTSFSRYGKYNKKSAEKRVKLLNDGIDNLREEFKF